MEILIVDLECTMPPVKRTGEIIQIGTSMLSVSDTRGSKITKNSPIYVLPKRTQLTPECTELTGIDSPTLGTLGVPLHTALAFLSGMVYDWWGSWGMFDYNKLDEATYMDNTEFPLRRNRYTNLKALFSIMCQTSKAYGLGSALDFLGLEFEGRPHDGADDAYNTARVIERILTGGS